MGLAISEIANASMAELARMSELIDRIYQGATEPSLWDAILPSLTDWIGGARSLLFTPLNAPDNGGFYFTHEISQPVSQLWWTRYHAQDIWAIRSFERGLIREGNIIIGDDVVSYSELSRTEIYRDFLSKHDITHLISSIVFGMESAQGNPYMVCSFLRGRQSGRFSPHERDRLAILLPHLSRSLGVMTRLRVTEHWVDASLSTLDRLSAGVLLLSARGRVTFANNAARRILKDEDGLRLKHCYGDSSLGNIVASHQFSQDTLLCAIRNAVSPDILQSPHFSHAVLVSRPSGRQAYMLNFSSLSSHNTFGSSTDTPRAIVFITDSAEPVQIDGELLSKTYGLTPAEILVTKLLAECLTVEETANRLGVSKSTIKTQQQSIYMKTNANSRAKLMRLIMSLPCVPRATDGKSS